MTLDHPAAGLPVVRSWDGLPDRVAIVEVGPRDGLQAETAIVPTATKIDFITRLASVGLSTIEATSFVSPRWVPQLADAAEVLAGIDPDAGDRPVLVPNLRGLERAQAAGARQIAVFCSATETFSRANLGADRATTQARAVEVARAASAAGLAVRGYVSMCFGDPWEGAVGEGDVAGVVVDLLAAGCHQVSLGDTIGVAGPGHVATLIAAVVAAGAPRDRIALHFHDTYGSALVNVLAGLQSGIAVFDSAAGGLGGCPYAKSATGNLATEDLVWMLTGLGYDTGVDLAGLVGHSRWLASVLGRPAPSRVVQAWVR